MFEIFDMLLRFVILPVLLLFGIVTIIGIVHDLIFGNNWNYNINDILGPEENDGLGDIDDDEETLRITN